LETVRIMMLFYFCIYLHVFYSLHYTAAVNMSCYDPLPIQTVYEQI
jgi:hypothetical protein